MSEELKLNVETREDTGTSAVRKLRREKKIPGVYYMHGQKNILVSIPRTELHGIWGHETTLLEIVFDGKDSKKAVIRDIQYDPIKGLPIHVDLMGIRMTEKLTLSVPVEIIGTSKGVKDSGGVLQQFLREAEIECLPADIPESIAVDVSELEIGDSIHLGDLDTGKFIFLSDPETLVVTVTPPRLVEEEEEEEELEEGEEGAEPEVIGQKSEEEEEE